LESDTVQAKWDARYRSTHGSAEGIAGVLTANPQLLPRAGRALDLACGLGANALYLAAHHLEVHAWDLSPVAIDRLNTRAQQQGLTLHTQVRDCLAQPPEADSFNVIIVSRFLERQLCPAITAALKPGGVLFYQTYTRAKQGGRGPVNPHFLLAAGELPRLFSELESVFYREGEEAQFVGRRGNK
jgi:tellurite methyltransferase